MYSYDRRSKVAAEYVPFGQVARKRLHEQAQYAARWLRDPKLGKGIRWKGGDDTYHTLEIHEDDVDIFVDRVMAYRRERGEID